MEDQVEIQAPSVVTPVGDPPAKKKLYDMLHSDQLYTKSYEEFDKKYSTPEAIGSLYNGLKTDGLYTKSRQDFDKQYFSSPTPAPQPKDNGIVIPEPVDPIKNLRDLKKIATTPVPSTTTTIDPTMGGSIIQVDKKAEDAQKKAQVDFNTSLTDFAKNNNLDVNNFKQAFTDFPNADAASLIYYTDLLKKNPTRYVQQQIGNQMLTELEKTKNPEINKYVNELNYNSVEADNLYQLNDQVQKGIAAIRAAPQDDIFGYAQNKKEAERLFEQKKSIEYNVVSPDMKKAYYDSGYRTSMGLSLYQFAGLEQIKAFHPEQYEQYIGILQNDSRPNQQSKEAKDDYEYQRGVEEVKMKLEKMGRENTERYLAYHLAENGEQIQSLTDEYKARIENAQSYEEKVALLKEYNSNPILTNALNLENEKEDLNYRMGQDDTNFPYHKAEYADQLITDALDEAKHGLGSRFLMTLGKTTDNTARWIGNTIINLLGSGEMKMNAAAKNIGHSKSIDNLFYQPKSLSGTESPFTLSNNMVGAIKNIFEDDRLDDEEKRSRAIAFIKDNQDMIKVNPKAGEHNWTVKSSLNAGLDTVASILGLVGETALMGGGNLAGASKLRGVVNTFTPMFMSTQQENYEKNLAAGVDHPYQRATAIAAIVSAAALINPPAKVIRGMFTKDPVMGKIIAGMDDAMIDNIIKANSKWVNMGKEFLKSSGRQLGLANLQYGLAAPLGEYAFNKGVMGDDVSLKRMLKDAFITTNITMALPVIFHGVTGARAAQVSPQQKYALYEAATNAEQRILHIDDLVKKGEISQVQGEQLRTVLEDAKTELDFLNNSSIKILEDKKAEVLFNMVRRKALERKLKEAKTDLEKSNVEDKIDAVDKEIVELKKPEPKEMSINEFRVQMKEEADALNAKIRKAGEDLGIDMDGKPNPKLEEAKVIMAEDVKDDYAEWTKNDQWRELSEKDPEGFLKMIADQAQGEDLKSTNADGSEKLVSNKQTAIDMFGKELVELAIDLNPKKEPSKISVIMPNETPKNETITIESKEPTPTETGESIPENKGAATQQSSEKGVPESTDATGSGGAEGGATVQLTAGDNVRLSHAETKKIYQELGLPERMETPTKPREVLEAEAKKMVDEGYDFDKKVKEVMSGKGQFEDVDQAAFDMKVAELKNEQKKWAITSPEFERLQNEIEKLSRASDVAGTISGRALQARRNVLPEEETLADFVMREKEVTKVSELTKNQKVQLEKEYQDLQDAKLKFEQEKARWEEETIKKMAAQELEKVKKTTSSKSKKTKDDFAKERKEIRGAISEKLRKSRGQANNIFQATVDFSKIAPDVLKLVKSYAEEGYLKLEDVVKAVHKDLKEDVENITEKDVHDIIAGVYNQKKQTRNDLAATLKDWRDEATLINKLEALERGEEPKQERAKIKRNQRIEELRQKIDAFYQRTKKSPEESSLAARKTRINNEIKQIEADLAAGNYEAPAKKRSIPMDKETLEAYDKLIKLKAERDARLIREQNAAQNNWQKAYKGGVEVLNAPRALMSSVDLSAPGRQALVASVSHPAIAGKAFVKMLQAAKSEKVFNRFFHELKESKDYSVMENSKLGLNDPLDPRLSAKEEAFMSNLAQKIPILGRFVKGSERAYVLYLNKMRVDIFRKGMDAFLADGKTPENSPELYKALASHINNITGRGNVGGKLENAVPALNTLFFSPRLMASRINLLTNFANPLFYKNVPKEVRNMYFKDMAKFLGFGATLIGVAALSGASVELDPRSSDFLKIKVGDTRYDVLGGFQQYVRTVAQIVSGQKKNLSTGQIKELDGKKAFGEDRGDVGMRFLRGKLAPVPGTAYDLISGRDILGNKILWQFSGAGKKEKDLTDVLVNFAPLISQDIWREIKDPSVKNLISIAASGLGFGVQNFGDEEGGDGGGSGADTYYGSPKRPTAPQRPTRPKRPGE